MSQHYAVELTFTEFSLKAHLNNEMVWPATLHQAVSREILACPATKIHNWI